MIVSNFYILQSSRVSKRESDKRIAYLQNTLAQLQEYHNVCKPLKRPIVLRLIANYKNLIEKLKG